MLTGHQVIAPQGESVLLEIQVVAEGNFGDLEGDALIAAATEAVKRFFGLPLADIKDRPSIKTRDQNLLLVIEDDGRAMMRQRNARQRKSCTLMSANPCVRRYW